MSDPSVHANANQAALEAEGAMQQVSVLQQPQKSDGQERMKYQISYSLHTLSYTPAHSTHNQFLTKFCGGEDLKHFLETAGRNATYTSHVAVVEFVEALGT